MGTAHITLCPLDSISRCLSFDHHILFQPFKRNSTIHLERLPFCRSEQIEHGQSNHPFPEGISKKYQ